MKFLLLASLLAASALAQTFPSFPIPAGIAVSVSYNQLGTPQYTGGLTAIYPVAGQAGVYGTTTADFYPHKTADPTTGKSFYAIQSSIRQGFHKDLLDAGHFSFLIGGDVGPSVASSAAGVTVNLSASFTPTVVYQISTKLGMVFAPRLLYINGAGWNPVPQVGLIFNLPGKK